MGTEKSPLVPTAAGGKGVDCMKELVGVELLTFVIVVEIIQLHAFAKTHSTVYQKDTFY